MKNGIIDEAKDQGGQAQRESIIQKIEADLYSEKIKRGEIPNKDKLIEILENSDYGTVKDDILTTNEGKYEIKLSEILGWKNQYITDGLLLHLDAINNTGEGDNRHSTTTTTWKDLSGYGNDGILQNFEGSFWNENYLNFDGIDDWVKLYEMNFQNLTMEIVGEFNIKTEEEMNFIANVDGGGYGLMASGPEPKLRISVFVNNGYCSLNDTEEYQENQKYFISGSYDGQVEKLFINEKKREKLENGTIKYPNMNTIMVLGANPYGDHASSGYLNGKIYAVRIYDRALSDEEVMNNYEIDKERFGIQ